MRVILLIICFLAFGWWLYDPSKSSSITAVITLLANIAPAFFNKAQIRQKQKTGKNSNANQAGGNITQNIRSNNDE